MAKAEPRSITRRSFVAALALPALSAPDFAAASSGLRSWPALPALATPDFAAAPSGLPPLPDPVFALIEAHVCAYKEFIAVLDDLAVAEQAAWHAPRGQRRAAKKLLAEAYAAEREFGDRESEAIARLLGTLPQTLHGAAAVLRYVRDWLEQGHSIEEEEHLALICSIECVICAPAERAPQSILLPEQSP